MMFLSVIYETKHAPTHNDKKVIMTFIFCACVLFNL